MIAAVDVRWWIWLHIAGVLGFVMAHGVSIGVSLRIRKERDPKRIAALLELSSRTILWFYVSFALLLVGGIVAGFKIQAWSQKWIWTALGVLLATMVFMYAAAMPYYRRLRTIAGAMAGGSEAVTAEQFAAVVASRRPYLLAAVGGGAFAFILWLMVFKPF